MIKKLRKHYLLIILIAPIAFAVLFIATGLFTKDSQDMSAKQKTPYASTTPTNNLNSSSQNIADQNNSQSEMLLYLIEEEKLAQDVYKAMYDKYGSTVFENIIDSEANHQAEVLKLLETRNIADPRIYEEGVFKNQELQDLYNQLIEMGGKSVTDAYKVGVTIEEKDIADIKNQLSTAKDQDIIDTLQSLLAASEKHLRAFNRQLNR